MSEKQSFIYDSEERAAIASRVNTVGIAGNIVLTVFKLFAGIVANSGAMISDGIHSASDVLSTFIVFVSMRMSKKGADEEHPYGHERFESVASFILSLILLIAGLGIGYSGIRKVIGLEQVDYPGLLALIAAAVSIVSKEGMYRYTIRAAEKLQSTALKSSAWHHRSDAFSSIGSLIGIFFAYIGYPKLDAVASIVISGFIIKVAIDILKESLDQIVDHSCDESTNEKIRGLVKSSEGVEYIDTLKTRLFGDRIYIDLEIAVDGEMDLNSAHGIAQSVHDRIEKEIPKVKHCMVHVNPAKKGGQPQ